MALQEVHVLEFGTFHLDKVLLLSAAVFENAHHFLQGTVT